MRPAPIDIPALNIHNREVSLRVAQQQVSPLNTPEVGAIQLTIGNLYASVPKLLKFLMSTGAIHFQPTEKVREPYRVLKEIDEKGGQATPADIDTFCKILQNATVSPNIAIRILGGEVCSDGKNELFILLVLGRLTREHIFKPGGRYAVSEEDLVIPPSIVFSRQSLEFLEFYHPEKYIGPLIGGSHSSSLIGFGQFIVRDGDSDSVFQFFGHSEHVKAFLCAVYMPTLKLIDYSIHQKDDQKTLVLYTTGFYGLETIKILTERLGLHYADETPECLAQTLECLNLMFHELMRGGALWGLIKAEKEACRAKRIRFLQDEVPLEYPWLRLLHNKVSERYPVCLPKKMSGYTLAACVGQQGMSPINRASIKEFDKAHDNVFSLDTKLGAIKRQSDDGRTVYYYSAYDRYGPNAALRIAEHAGESMPAFSVLEAALSQQHHKNHSLFDQKNWIEQALKSDATSQARPYNAVFSQVSDGELCTARPGVQALSMHQMHAGLHALLQARDSVTFSKVHQYYQFTDFYLSPAVSVENWVQRFKTLKQAIPDDKDAMLLLPVSLGHHVVLLQYHAGKLRAYGAASACGQISSTDDQIEGVNNIERIPFKADLVATNKGDGLQVLYLMRVALDAGEKRRHDFYQEPLLTRVKTMVSLWHFANSLPKTVFRLGVMARLGQMDKDLFAAFSWYFPEKPTVRRVFFWLLVDAVPQLIRGMLKFTIERPVNYLLQLMDMCIDRLMLSVTQYSSYTAGFLRNTAVSVLRLCQLPLRLVDVISKAISEPAKTWEKILAFQHSRRSLVRVWRAVAGLGFAVVNLAFWAGVCVAAGVGIAAACKAAGVTIASLPKVVPAVEKFVTPVISKIGLSVSAVPGAIYSAFAAVALILCKVVKWRATPKKAPEIFMEPLDAEDFEAEGDDDIFEDAVSEPTADADPVAAHGVDDRDLNATPGNVATEEDAFEDALTGTENVDEPDPVTRFESSDTGTELGSLSVVKSRDWLVVSLWNRMHSSAVGRVMTNNFNVLFQPQTGSVGNGTDGDNDSLHSQSSSADFSGT